MTIEPTKGPSEIPAENSDSAAGTAGIENKFRRYVFSFFFVATILAGSYELIQQFIRVGCWGGGYSQDAWMAYCDSKYYGGYEHAAIWFGLEPEVTKQIQQAQVLTLSSSRLQEALSVSRAFDWFSQHGISLYMLGLGYDEQSGFAELLFKKLHPHPLLLIINADPFVTGLVSDQAKIVLDNPQSELEAAIKLKEFQQFHKTLCTNYPWMCKYTSSGFRSRVDGHWIYPPTSGPDELRTISIFKQQPPTGTPVLPAPATSPEKLANYRGNAERLLNLLNIPRECVVFTTVPSSDQSSDISNYLAQAVGGRSVVPNVADLYTRDGSHLTEESARRWSSAFISELQPIINNCIANKVR